MDVRKLALAALGAALVFPSIAQAHGGNLQKTDRQLRASVKATGQSPGRDIVRWGMPNGHRPSRARVETYFAVMRRMVLPASAPVAAAPAATATTAYTPSSGGYCGAYQFDQQTWTSVGMSGSPCGASPAQQDAAARKLMSERGNEPWPVCGAGAGTYDLAKIRQCENSGSYR